MKVMAFLFALPGIDPAQVRDHYENHHVPLILSLGPAPLSYKRNYLVHDGSTPRAQDECDVVTELVFADRPSYERWVATMYAPGSGIAEDEATFLDRTRTRSFVVEECTTT